MEADSHVGILGLCLIKICEPEKRVPHILFLYGRAPGLTGSHYISLQCTAQDLFFTIHKLFLKMLEIIIAQLEEILREKGFQLDSEVPKDSKYLHFLMMVLTSLEMSQQ